MDVIEQQWDHGKGTDSEKGAVIRILLVDDHCDTVLAIQAILESRGYHVLTGGSLAEAEMKAAGGFDLLLCDIDLPDGTGIELLERLNATRPVRAIAMSGYGMAEDIERSMQAGFRRHLIKPFTSAKLFDAIALALS